MLKKHQISLKLTASQYAHIQDCADSESTTITNVVRQLIDNDRRQNFAESKSVSEIKKLDSRFTKLIIKLDELLLEESEEVQS
ncbi:MAG: hypothetical protein AUK35_06380 [Zetaproteobacteria bacterium CG2_30_46_52]|nr:MAG: hypothetical protein AUK35_06380 [Zetaproteobacteria bacterium CG2_30_46_52]